MDLKIKRSFQKQQHTQILMMVEKKGVGAKGFVVARVVLQTKAATLLMKR